MNLKNLLKFIIIINIKQLILNYYNIKLKMTIKVYFSS